MKRTVAWCVCLMILAGSLLSGCDLHVQSKGQISVKSDPERAEVLINGKSQGQAPITVKGLLGGDYLVELRKEGYSKLYKSISLLDGQQLELNLQMKPVSGLLLVESNPPISSQSTLARVISASICACSSSSGKFSPRLTAAASTGSGVVASKGIRLASSSRSSARSIRRVRSAAPTA